MKKYNLRTPDENQCTFEVRRLSAYTGCGTLNRQIIILLEVLLKDPRILLHIQKENIESLCKMMEDTTVATRILQNHTSSSPLIGWVCDVLHRARCLEPYSFHTIKVR